MASGWALLQKLVYCKFCVMIEVHVDIRLRAKPGPNIYQLLFILPGTAEQQYLFYRATASLTSTVQVYDTTSFCPRLYLLRK